MTILLGFPGIPADWRTPDLTAESNPTMHFRYRLDGKTLSFLTTLTVFNAPQNITAEELRIESCFPLDAATDAACRELAGD